MSADLQIASSKQPQPSASQTCNPLVSGQLTVATVEIAQKVHESFLRSLDTATSELLQEPVATTFLESRQAPVSLVLGDAASNHLIALDLAPVKGRAFLSFPPSLLFRVLDILLATPENAGSDAERSVTEIELYILREFFEIFAESLRIAWNPFYPAAFEQLPPSMEKSEPVAGQSENDPAVIFRATMEIAGTRADFDFIMPAFLARLGALKSHTAVSREVESHPVRASLPRLLGDAVVRMDAVLKGPSIRIRDLVELSLGQVLLTGSPGEVSIDCLVNGNPQFSGELVPVGRKCGFRIESLTADQLGTPFASDR